MTKNSGSEWKINKQRENYISKDVGAKCTHSIIRLVHDWFVKYVF